MLGTSQNDWTSMAASSDGSYGTPDGVYCSFPVSTAGGEYHVIEDLEVNEFSRERIDRSTAELLDERDSVASLGLLP
jgi:malate dehydrogenase